MLNETCEVCCNCAGYINNWFYTYQWFCVEDPIFKLTLLGAVVVCVALPLIAFWIWSHIPIIMRK